MTVSSLINTQFNVWKLLVWLLLITSNAFASNTSIKSEFEKMYVDIENTGIELIVAGYVPGQIHTALGHTAIRFVRFNEPAQKDLVVSFGPYTNQEPVDIYKAISGQYPTEIRVLSLHQFQLQSNQTMSTSRTVISATSETRKKIVQTILKFLDDPNRYGNYSAFNNCQSILVKILLEAGVPLFLKEQYGDDIPYYSHGFLQNNLATILPKLTASTLSSVVFKIKNFTGEKQIDNLRGIFIDKFQQALQKLSNEELYFLYSGNYFNFRDKPYVDAMIWELRRRPIQKIAFDFSGIKAAPARFYKLPFDCGDRQAVYKDAVKTWSIKSLRRSSLIANSSLESFVLDTHRNPTSQFNSLATGPQADMIRCLSSIFANNLEDKNL